MIEDKLWVADCIKSCVNTFQLECCLTLMQLFEQKYTDSKELNRNYSELMTAYQEQHTFLSIEV